MGVIDEAPAGTFTMICVPAAFAFAVTFIDPKNTSFGPEGLKLLPAIVMLVPSGPDDGERLVIVGA